MLVARIDFIVMNGGLLVLFVCFEGFRNLLLFRQKNTFYEKIIGHLVSFYAKEEDFILL